VHPAGGHVYFYRDMVQCLGPDQPVYGIEAQGVDGKAEPLTRVEEMAAHYVAALRALWPDGPFLLGGASFGGIVAFEMARQLSALGKEAAMVAIIDAGGPGQMPREKLEDDDVMILSYLLGVGADTVISPDDLRKLEPDERLRFFLERGRQSIRLSPDYGLAELLPFLRIFKLNLRAMREYAPQPYAGRVVFFRARERDPINPQNPELAWAGVARGGLTVHEVPGNHITMNFLPNVQVMADLLKAHIDDTPSERGSRRSVDSHRAVDAGSPRAL
jgi:thioesterase domain-containing protein